MDFDAIKKAAQKYGPDMTRFLRDMIAIPSESCEEKGVVYRIKEEMEKQDTSGIWEQKNTPYISGVAESTLISKGYVKYITYTGTFDGGVGESGNVRLRITRVNALAELIQYHGTVRVEITTET